MLFFPFSVAGNEKPGNDFDGTWRGSLTCGETISNVAFKSPRRINIQNSQIKMRRGTPNRDRFEVWEGTVDPSGTVLIFGRYFWKTDKPLWFKGHINVRKLEAAGQRGPKICELLLVRILKNTKGTKP